MLAQHNGGMSTTPKERRARARARSYKEVKILTEDKKSVFNATLRNVTAYGASLSVALTERVPNRFNLHFVHDDMTVPCEIKWRRMDSIGVIF